MSEPKFVLATLRGISKQIIWAAAVSVSALASAASLQIEDRLGHTQTVETRTLAIRADGRELDVPSDPAYHAPAHYRGVALMPLLKALGVDLQSDESLEVVATDGFVAHLPAKLLLGAAEQRAVAYLAFESETSPWPKLPGKNLSAGPFYIVWSPDANVGSEQWPYNVAKLAVRQAPAKRWPQLTVDGSLSADHPARRGQTVFLTQCVVCHKMNGGGEAVVGPDLNLPMNPTEYFQPLALRKFIRNPSSVRNWPNRAMPAFAVEQLSDQDLDDLIAYLQHMAPRKAP
jgi:mono/diheme cytochrome c family protein